MFQNSLKLSGNLFRRLTPNIPLQNITIGTTQATYLRKQPAPLPEFSRQFIKDLNEKPTPEQQKIIDHEKKVQAQLKSIYETKQNDRNPANHIKVKVNLLQKYQTEENLPASTTAPLENLAQPHILLVQPKRKKVTFYGIRRRVPVSMKKILPFMKAIVGMHVYDALNLCLNSQKKAAKFVAIALQQVKKHGTDRDFHEERFYITDAITGKNKRYKRLRYHAKGRGAFMIKDTTQLLIRMEEKPAEEMYKEMVQGKTPPMLAHFMRKNLLEKDADYETLRKSAHMLTAKGRQQRKLMFKRKVIQQQLAFRV